MSVRWNVKQQICSVVGLINVFNVIKVLRCLSGATQLNFFCSFNMTDLEGRSREQDGPHHTTLWPGSSGACASQWGRC